MKSNRNNSPFAIFSSALMAVFIASTLQAAVPLDRETLVKRHNIVFTEFNPAEIPQVGNGEIAFGIDPTGLQSCYGNTLSQWGWHSTVPPVENPVAAFKMFEVKVQGHTATYPVSTEGQTELYTWLRENPHRLNLGRLSLLLDGTPVDANEITEINQKLDLWRGVITSHYSLAGSQVTVVTTCHPTLDMLAVQVNSPLVANNRLAVQIAFPYGNATDRSGADWNAADRHSTSVEDGNRIALFQRTLDKDHYEVLLGWDAEATLRQSAKHTYVLQPAVGSERFSFVCQFAPHVTTRAPEKFQTTLASATAHWRQFWSTGGAIDLSRSKDPRWKELERRVVLSQYLLAVNEAGRYPPQESGLVNNSGWYGKFHLEMHWWHGAHYQLWNRWALFERSLGWYHDILPAARKIAKRQGYRGRAGPRWSARTDVLDHRVSAPG